ncbi:hypothetical protein HMPREF0793_1674 [Staphylococcus caprae M23864:W1]|nr:hypothetical protein HMPREF0793_1674 [Staphylococcus caprae M23864:W1]
MGKWSSRRSNPCSFVIDKWEGLKWNLINMMNIMVQIIDKSLKKLQN